MIYTAYLLDIVKDGKSTGFLGSCDSKANIYKTAEAAEKAKGKIILADGCKAEVKRVSIVIPEEDYFTTLR